MGTFPILLQFTKLFCPWHHDIMTSCTSSPSISNIFSWNSMNENTILSIIFIWHGYWRVTAQCYKWTHKTQRHKLIWIRPFDPLPPARSVTWRGVTVNRTPLHRPGQSSTAARKKWRHTETSTIDKLNCHTTKTKYNVILSINTTQPHTPTLKRNKHSRAEQSIADQIWWDLNPLVIRSRIERWNADPNTQRGLLAGTATFGAPHWPSWTAAIVLSTGKPFYRLLSNIEINK